MSVEWAVPYAKWCHRSAIRSPASFSRSCARHQIADESKREALRHARGTDDGRRGARGHYRRQSYEGNTFSFAAISHGAEVTGSLATVCRTIWWLTMKFPVRIIFFL